MSSIQVYDASHEAPSTDPPVTLAVVVGGASPIERETSLASARTLIDAIHTAALVAPAMPGASAGSGEAAVTRKDEEDADDDVHGVEVNVYMLAGNGLVYRWVAATVYDEPLAISQALPCGESYRASGLFNCTSLLSPPSSAHKQQVMLALNTAIYATH